ncbi:MAG: carboxypeptidase regulatory-like domain-containing protein [Methanobacteriota archaeon]|nr:MAG: carboxypeptidase regulatory-like domain-containing protein [Euryarchaeota archaeon]
MTYEFLYAVGPMMEPYPQLAASHEVSNGNLTWTYHLVEDSYWHDGLPVTAHDVEFTFKMIMDYPQECALLAGYLEGFDEVTALDNYTVQIDLLRPKANMLSLIVPILPEHLWSKVRDDGVIDTVDMFETDYFPDGPVGSGPFILEEYRMAEGEIHLLAQKPYHRLPGIEVDSVNIDKLIFVIYKSDNALITALETGDIDVVDGVPPSVWETVIANPDIDGQTPATLILEEFGFNCAPKEWRLSETGGERNFPTASTNYETTNLTVRQACTMATDIEYIANEIHQGMAQPAYGLIPPATPFWHYNVPEEERWDYGSHEDCVAAANQMLEDAGYRYISSPTVRENESSGALLEFEFYYIRANIHDEQTAEMMQIWWADIGVKVNLYDESEGKLYDLMSNMEYDMFIWSWWPDVDPTWFLSVLTTDEIPVDNSDTTAWSDCFYTNPYYDQLWWDQQEAMDLYERQAIVHEMQQIVYRDCPYICLVYPSGLIGYRTDEYENFPDMEVLTGISPSSFWYYFAITPIGSTGNTAPYNVDMDGDDRTVFVGTEATFSGSADDLESPDEELNWTWTIMELLDTTTLYGQNIKHFFNETGESTVTLEVKDPEGLSGNLDSITVTVIDVPVDAGWIIGYVNDTEGEPIAGALVIVSEASSQQSSDEEGFYNHTVESGTYEIYATAEGYSNESASVTVVMGNTTWQNFTLSVTSGSVAGDVLDSVDTSVAIAGALVELYRPGDEEAAYAKKTDDSGSFEITLVDEGTYEVVVSKTGYETNDTETVTVVSNETASLTIHLTAVEEDEDGGGGLGTIAIVVGILALIAAVAAAALLLKRRKGPEPETIEGAPPEEAPPEEPPPET